MTRAPRPPSRFHHLYRWMALMTLAIAAIGCAPSSLYMREVAVPQPLQPAPGQALVVFVRPSGFAFSMKFAVFNHDGRFLGESLASTHFAVSLPPGRHLFIIWAENTASLQADLAADRIYYVEVSPKMGMLSARGHLMAITPRRPSWAELPEWLASTKRLLSNMAAGQAYLDSRRADLQERIRRGHEHWGNYTAEERDERTILAPDGVAGPSGPTPTPAPTRVSP